MRAKRKADYHHGNLRRALIDAAVSAIAKHGIDALNLRQLAARAGVTPGAPYHHFAEREELLSAIAEEGFERLEAELIAARDAAGAEAGARLEALGRAYITFAVSRPGYFRVMFHGDAKSSRPTRAGPARVPSVARRRSRLSGGRNGAGGRSGALVLTAWSAVHGFATLWVDRALPFEGMRPELMAPELGRLLARMFAALARVPA